MRSVKFVWLAGVSVLAAAVATSGRAAEEDAKTNAAINAAADLLEKNDAKGAAKAIADANTEIPDVETLMGAFKLRSPKGIGIGVGATKGAITPDGIEKMIIEIDVKGVTPAALKKNAAALAHVGHVTNVIAQLATIKAPADDGKKKKSDWLMWSGDMVKSSQEFAAAAKAEDAAGLKKAASKILQSCDSCHKIFK